LALTRPDLEIHTLEYDIGWAARTREALERAGVTNVTLHHAPLTEQSTYVDGQERVWRWYGATDLPARVWALVVNDGPPRTKGDRAALYAMLGSLLNEATILCDDTHDPAQLAPLQAWAKARGRQVLSEEDEGKCVS